MNPKQQVSRQCLAEFLARDLASRYLVDRELILARLRFITSHRAKWIEQLADAIHSRYGRVGHASRMELRFWLSDHPALKRGFGGSRKLAVDESVFQIFSHPEYRWEVPHAQNETQLCDLLCLRSPQILHWLETPHIRRDTKVDHYQRRLLRTSGGRSRWIEQPRPVLKRVQRLIATEILSQIPLHDAAHAYRPGRSVRSCASPHVGKRVVLKMDLENFFGRIPLRRVAALFRHVGYPRPVALSLARICTAPAILSPDSDNEPHLRSTRLPIGGPSSPGIANAIAFQLDRRLAGLSRSLDVRYTRYADDLIFSGNQTFAARVDRFATTVAVIAMEEGFQVQYRKTRAMFSGDRQRVLGLNVNERLNTDRKQYEQLKAILTNCIRHGWRSQNRDSLSAFREHLQGRIGYIGQTNAARYKKLTQLFAQIDWS
ncbi:reverse transcriptase family protein [Novipirellula sp. SH528]|uniref:reverse transcriptase family protein n=1 Tax=Novipirellula sp. SH528 TaxID=3454466 RepID=UPI003F9F3F6D